MRDRDQELREALRRTREAAGLSQENVAEAIGTSQVNVSRWERRFNPTLTEAAAIAEACGCELEVTIRRKDATDVEVRTTPAGADAARMVERMNDLQWRRARRFLENVPTFGPLHWNTIRIQCEDAEERRGQEVDAEAAGRDED